MLETKYKHESTRYVEAPPPVTDAAPPFDGSGPWGADVILRSSDNVDFHVLKAPLAYSSPIFRTMFTLPRGDQPGVCEEEGPMVPPVDEMRDGLPVVRLPESGTVLYRLLHMCYHDCAVTSTAASEMHTLDDVIEVLKPAAKYGMDGVERHLLTAPRFLEAEPLRVFALAMRHRLEREARAAAVMTLRTPLRGNLYIPELESLTAGDLLRLHEYQIQCAAAVQGVAKHYSWMGRDWVWSRCKPCSEGGWGVRSCNWWLEYMQLAAKELTNTLAGATVLGEGLMDQALAKAGPHCQPARARAEMRKFVQLFAAKIDQTISEVPLEIQFR